MADNSTKIILTAEDRTGGALASVTRGLGSMQAEALRATAALSAIGFTAAAAGATAYVRSIINAADETQKLSQRIGIATKDIAGWKLAADLSGASLESVAKGIKGLATYSAEYGETLRQVGIDTQDPQRALTQLADLFAALPDGLQKTALATTLFGKAGLDMIPMLNQGSAALEEQRKKAEEYGRKMAEIGPDAEKFNDNLEETAFYAKAVGMNIAAYFMPGLAGLSKLLVDVAKGGDDAYNALEWLWGERIAKGAALLHSDRFGKGLKREAGGRIGGDMSPVDEEALAAQNIAGMRAAEIVARAKESAGGKGGKGKAAKAQRFDPEGDTLYAIEEANRKAARASFDDAEKAAAAEAKRLDSLRRKYIDIADPLQKYREQLDEIRMLQEQGKLSADQALEAEFNVQDKMSEAMRETTSDLKKQNDMARELGMTFSSAFEDAVIGGKKAGDVIRALGQDIARIGLRKAVTEPLGKAAGSLFDKALGSIFDGMGSSSGGSFDWMPSFAGGGYTGSLFDKALGSIFDGMGSSSGGSFDWMPSFAGGGYTGSGGRSGGLDGQGGFMAMLHPNETVTDHAAGGSAPGSGMSFSFQIDARGAEVGVERRIEAAVSRAVGMAVAAVAQQADRGGSYARALGRR